MGNSNKEKRNLEHNNQDKIRGTRDGSIGNLQGTTQTGDQNAGGENIDQEEDNFTEDLRNSGQRNSSNRKTES